APPWRAMRGRRASGGRSMSQPTTVPRERGGRPIARSRRAARFAPAAVSRRERRARRRPRSVREDAPPPAYAHRSRSRSFRGLLGEVDDPGTHVDDALRDPAIRVERGDLVEVRELLLADRLERM